LFPAYRDGQLDDELHYTQMIALMGPPPKEFLDRMNNTLRARFWDSSGKRHSRSSTVEFVHNTDESKRKLDCENVNSVPNT